MWEQNSIDLHIKHIYILVSWFFAQNLHFANVFLHVLIKCSNFWHLWHWLTRLFKNSLTCKTFSLTIKSFLRAFFASIFSFKLILTKECVLFSRFQLVLIRSIHVQALNRCMSQFLFEIDSLICQMQRFQLRVQCVRIRSRLLKLI
jgi:hypothetical protein